MRPLADCATAPYIERFGPRVMLPAVTPLTVIELFERSMYLHDQAGALYCIVQDGLPLGPFNLHCAGWDQLRKHQITRGMVVADDGRSFFFSSGIVMSYARARRWRPEMPAPESASHVGNALNRIGAMNFSDKGGLGSLMPMVLGVAPVVRPENVLDARLVASGASAVGLLSGWLENGEKNALFGAVDGLLGLGPGLTPSGDDILAGAMFGLRLLGEREGLAALRQAIFSRPSCGTSKISRAYLKAASQGSVSAPLLEAAGAICADAPDLESRLGALADVGHSSGFDALIGLLLPFAALNFHSAALAAPKALFRAAKAALRPPFTQSLSVRYAC